MTPLLETGRLRLRGFRLEDFPAHAAIWQHPRTTRDFEGYGYDEEMCWLRFQRNFGHWQMLGYGVWAVEEKAGGRYIGSMGFINARRGMNLPFDDAPEAAWLIAPDRHGQGLASEGLRAVFAWADARFDRTWCMINSPNTISQKVAARFGFRRQGEGNYRGTVIPTYLRPRGGGG